VDSLQSRLWVVAKIALALALVGFVIQQVDLEALGAALQRMDVAWVAPSITLFFVMLGVMAARTWNLIGRRAAFTEMLALTAMQTVVGNLFATSAGAASLVTALRLRHDVSVVQGVSSVVIAKLGDLLVLVAFLALGSAMVWPTITTLHALVLVLIVALTGMLIVVGLVIRYRAASIGAIQEGMLRLGLRRWGVGRKLSEALTTLAQEPQQPPSQMTSTLLLLSLLNGVVGIGFGYSMSRLLGLPLELGPLLFFSALTQLVSWLPIQVFGGLGTYEITGLYVLRLFILETDRIAPYLLSARVLLYVLTILLIPLLLLPRWERASVVAQTQPKE
jgi:uncharacterized membrane protein YbhN (UPF0104 family)